MFEAFEECRVLPVKEKMPNSNSERQRKFFQLKDKHCCIHTTSLWYDRKYSIILEHKITPKALQNYITTTTILEDWPILQNRSIITINNIHTDHKLLSNNIPPSLRGNIGSKINLWMRLFDRRIRVVGCVGTSGVNGGLSGLSNLEESIESLSEILPEVLVFPIIGAVKFVHGNSQSSVSIDWEMSTPVCNETWAGRYVFVTQCHHYPSLNMNVVL